MAASNGTGVPPPPSAAMPSFYYQPQQQLHYSLGRDNHSPEEDGTAAKAAASSPWHRMKWTDAMVCLLIKIVFLMGDDGAPDSEPTTAKGKKAAATAAASQHLKKGKWKSVSKEMMEKGHYVSPQQCEDKFNDLNKRYKRVNDLLGKGTACRVVENQSLLDLLDYLSPKEKEEARKLLNSKHLFFREMCNYHNGGGAAPTTATVAAPLPSGCSHHPTAGVGRVVGHEDEDDSVDGDMDMDMYDEEDDDDDDSHGAGKQQPVFAASPPLSLSLWSGAPGGSMTREWMKRKVMALEEQRVMYQCEALRLERRRFKWARFRGEKEREMEGRRLENESRRLENERMLLMLRQKELELRNSGGGASASSLSVHLAGERGQ